MSGAKVARLVSFTALAFAFLVSPRPTVAWPEDPALNVALCNAAGDQTNAVGVPDGAGGAIVTWADRRNGSYEDIYVQRISSRGEVLWTVNGVALCTANSTQRYPAIASDSAGGAIVAWEDQRSTGDIYAQRISAAGAVLWTANGVALCTATGMQALAAIVADGAGGAIVAWEDPRSGNTDIYAQRVSSEGAVQWAADGVPLCTATGNQRYPVIATDSAGGAIVAWHDFRVAAPDIYAQRVSAEGVVQWAADGVPVCDATGNQLDPAIIADGSGGAILVWQDSRGSSPDIYTQRLSAEGVAQWTANGLALCLATGDQQRAALASDGAGGAIVAWQDCRGIYYDIYAQRVTAGGEVEWTANGVPICTAAQGQGVAQVVPDGVGGAIIGWEDYRGESMDIYAQRVTADGEVEWTANGVPICFASGNQWTCTLVPDGENGAIIAWQDYRDGAADIYAQRVWANGTTPVLVSLVESGVVGDQVVVTWLVASEVGGTATIYRSRSGGDWAVVGNVTPDGAGYLRYAEPVDAAATRVGYRLGIVDGGVEATFGETWVDLPRRVLALDGVAPNPTPGRPLRVRFSLPNPTPATLELVDVSGRRLLTREVGSLGSGPHVLELGDGPGLPAGIYLLRLRQGASSLVTRVAVMR